MKVTTQRLIKMITQPNSFGQAPAKEDIDKEKDEFFKKLLPSLDQQLNNKKFFCGNQVTVADL